MSESEKERHLQDGLILNNRYKILRFLSSGGFGNTYEAEDLDEGSHVAIKELFISGTCKRESDDRQVSISVAENRALFRKQKEKFRKEAARLRAINHPGVVKVCDEFEENGTAYYVMDYVRGKSLDDMLRDGQLNEKKSVQYIKQVLSAIEAVHDAGILHLDIKPSNVMINENNKAIVIDFGASKQLETVDGKSLSLSTGIACTPGYAPIEQMSGKRDLMGRHTDIYAIGATLYKLITGITPPDPSEIAVTGSLPDFKASPEVVAVVKASVQNNFNARPQSIADFRAILNGGGGGVTPPNPGPQPGPVPIPGGTISIEEAREREKRRRRRMLLVGSLIGVFILAGLLTWLFMNGTPFDSNVDDGYTSKDSSEKIEQLIVDEPQQPVADAVIDQDVEVDADTIVGSAQKNYGEAVDLGLSVLWCDRNVGAESTSGNGNLYTFDEAFSVSKSMGSGWRLPTDTELEELSGKCTWSWTGSGSRVTGPNGNSIYLPAACCGGDVGDHGCYWSSPPFFTGEVFCLFFFNGVPDVSCVHGVSCHSRSSNYSARLVRAK